LGLSLQYSSWRMTIRDHWRGRQKHPQLKSLSTWPRLLNVCYLRQPWFLMIPGLGSWTFFGLLDIRGA
jgi:hypothetical protein